MAKKKLPTWLKSFLIALPLGVLIGAPLPLIYFLSERRDWGKTYQNYSDFVSAYVGWGVLYSLIGTVLVWLLLVFS